MTRINGTFQSVFFWFADTTVARDPDVVLVVVKCVAAVAVVGFTFTGDDVSWTWRDLAWIVGTVDYVLTFWTH